MYFNLSYYLEPCGWSYCSFDLENKKIEIRITHIFSSNPIEDCINSLMRLIDGEVETNFIWYDEPGGCLLKIKESEDDHIELNLNWFEDEIDENYRNYQFTVKKEILIIMFYYEFKKLSKLLKDKDYSKDRSEYFPFQKFNIFEKRVQKHLNN